MLVFMSVVSILLLAALGATIYILKGIYAGAQSLAGECRDLKEAKAAADKRLMEIMEALGRAEGERDVTKSALQEVKCRFGLVKKSLNTTIEGIRGKNFKSKKETLERSKHFKQLIKLLDSL